MFTGIIEATAPILDVSKEGIAVAMPKEFTDVKPGSSIAVNGCCLTVKEICDDGNHMTFDFSEETLQKTAFLQKKTGDLVNLERAMPADGRLDGHIVQGHIEGMGEVVESTPTSLRIRIQNEFKENVVLKGSIAIDGISLTIASIEGNEISAAIIPYTYEHTVLHTYKEGDLVNVETDVLAKYARGIDKK